MYYLVCQIKKDQSVGTQISVCDKSCSMISPVVWAINAKYVNIVLKINVKMLHMILLVTAE